MTRAHDRFDLMRTFVRVAETGTLTAAAQSLGLTQPSVSRQLKQLETLFGVQLAQRTTHDLTLTPEGDAVLQECRRLLDAWEAVAERIGGHRREPSGLLRAIVPVGLGQTILVDLLARFRRRHPAVRVDWILADGPVDLPALGADCLIRVGSITDADLIVRRIGEVHRILVAAPDLLAAVDATPESVDPARLPAVALSPYHGARLDLVNAQGQPSSVSLDVVFASDNLFAARRAAVAGLGIALLPTWLVVEDLAARRLVRVAPELEAPRLPVLVGYPAGRYRPARLTAFIRMLQEEPVGNGLAPAG